CRPRRLSGRASAALPIRTANRNRRSESSSGVTQPTPFPSEIDNCKLQIDNCKVRLILSTIFNWQFAIVNWQFAIVNCRSVVVPVPHDAEKRLDRVFEGDLLAFLIGAAGVADGHLVDAPGWAALGDLGGDLRLETEAVRLQRH